MPQGLVALEGCAGLRRPGQRALGLRLALGQGGRVANGGLADLDRLGRVPGRLAGRGQARAQALRARKLRTALSGLGIAIGIAAAVAVLGISASSRANLLAELGAEGNLLTVSAGQAFDGSPAPLPLTAEPMIAHIPPVESVTATGYVSGATVRRTAAVPAVNSGGISVLAAQPGLLGTLGGSLAAGTFLNAATARYPAVVLGAVAARTLGIARVHPDTQVYLAGRYFTVIGILRPVPIAPEIDEAALVSALGGVAGAAIGAAVTAGYAAGAGQPTVVPPAGVAAGIGVALVTGVLAGGYPALRAARLAPAEALRAV
jgi:ABC-type antimicrobial peptide transport system permease subunit